ncbi:hypothetical protein C6501_15880 [Candidatus Poribacteria bacterium]|nr:MAG: hypothetical protein C6501_15880 [Candidatus Poribacteria bacterium]
MKWFNRQTKSCVSALRYVGRRSCQNRQIKVQHGNWALLNLGMLFLLGLIVSGCGGQSLTSMSPIQPVHNIADALNDPSPEVVIPAIPSEDLAKPVLDKHGLQTVGFRLAKVNEANTKALTYMLAFPEYAYSIDDWNNFLTDWAEVEPQIELPRQNEDRKRVDVILISDNPQTFEVQAKQNILTKTQDGITVSICYWRRADLDRKYNRGNAFSPFYETETLKQGDKTDVYYVQITNNRTEHIIFDVRKCTVVDQGENVYQGLNYEDLRLRFSYMSRASGLYVTNGLKKAKEILLEKRMHVVERQVGAHRVGVEPGKSAEGFVPFRQVKRNAVELTVILPIEKAPPSGGIQRYQTVEFKFPFTHSRGIRIVQPAPHRY